MRKNILFAAIIAGCTAFAGMASAAPVAGPAAATSALELVTTVAMHHGHHMRKHHMMKRHHMRHHRPMRHRPMHHRPMHHHM